MVATATLPIVMDRGLDMDPVAARGLGERFAGAYALAAPFPHVVLDDFLPPEVAERATAEFPRDPKAAHAVYELGYAGRHKREIKPSQCGPFSRELFALFNSEAMLQFLEGLTGIAGLLPDPYFEGGGYHEIAAGGLLGIHADFRINQALRLERRINVLIYLNPGWNEDWGGALELWDPSMRACVKSIPPIFDRCVIFNTDATAYHGHPNPLACPPEVFRRSIALYYYTASDRVFEDVPALGTLYRARPQESVATRLQVRRLQLENHAIREWLPPVLFRALTRMRRMMRPASPL
ncbi:MAG: 2OG-Fe(II) oxygenase [Caulobacteraceae bacterium]|nr:2OG-Fe(II) oxygenase [Caulobacteraceae bacterium]